MQLYMSPEGDDSHGHSVSGLTMLLPTTSHSAEQDLLDDFDDYMQEQNTTTYAAEPSPAAPRLLVEPLPPLSPQPQHLSSPFKQQPRTPKVDPATAYINDDLAQFEEWFLGGNVIIEDT